MKLTAKALVLTCLVMLGCGRPPLPGLPGEATDAATDAGQSQDATVTEKSALIYGDNLSGTYTEFYQPLGQWGHTLTNGFSAHLTITNAFSPSGWFTGSITFPAAVNGAPPPIVSVTNTSWWSSGMQFMYYLNGWHFAFCNHASTHRWSCYTEAQQLDGSYVQDATLTLY